VAYEVRRNGYVVSTDPAALDLDAVHDFLANRSYWSAGISRERLAAAIERSIPFGVYHDGRQVGFTRVITDGSTIAYIADVYVDEAYRGRGLSKLLMEAVMAHPELQHLKRWILGTKDAHSLYARYGFKPLTAPERWMELVPEESAP